MTPSRIIESSFGSRRPPPKLRRIGEAIWNAKLWIQKATLAITCGLFTAIIIIQIVFRYFLFLPLHGMEELATYLAIWTYFVGGAYGAYERSHISASLIQMIVKNPRINLIVKLVVNLITVVVAIWMGIWALKYLAWSVRTEPHSLELRTPLYWVHACMFTGLALMSLYFLIELTNNLRAFFRLGQKSR
ncbi:MAG: TRAP transporter small permease [Rhodospirillales bacterium]|nr:TRAP transporter small permease [Rhodospirillales bacterium]